MKIGAERKRIAILSGLGLVLAYFVYTNVFSSSTDQSPARTPRTTAAKAALTKPAAPDISRPAPLKLAAARPDSNEFRPSLERRPEEFIDPMQADPTLHLELMAKVQSVQIEGGARNLFQFGAPPAPKIPEIKVPVKDPQTTAKTPGGSKPADPQKPPPTPIPLKFYGFTSPMWQTNKRAFFMNGDDIIVAAEGDVINKRYKVIRIGVNSAVVEDTENQNQQTLPLEEQTG